MHTFAGDHTAALLREGYAFLPNRRRLAGEDAFRTRLLGRKVVCVRGVEATRAFYDEDRFLRAGVLPRPVRRTLTGERAVHTLDGDAHRHRKEMFLALREADGVRALVERTVEEWEAATVRWSGTGQVVLLDEAAEILTESVCGWAGVRFEGNAHLRRASADMVAMVDAFGSVGARHVRGRRARRRAERRLERVVLRARASEGAQPAGGSMFDRILRHRDENGDLLDPRLVAVETLNVLRPTVAIAWFVAFAAHALHRWPDLRGRLRDGDDAFARAFAHEVRRFYPFAPVMGAVARRDMAWEGDVIEAGTLVLLDLFGQNHDENLWKEPYAFRPERFLDHPPGLYDLVPQGGGDVGSGHRCPGEDIVVATLTALVPRLAALRYDVPEQDLTISLGRIPTRPRSGVLLENVRPGRW